MADEENGPKQIYATYDERTGTIHAYVQSKGTDVSYVATRGAGVNVEYDEYDNIIGVEVIL